MTERLFENWRKYRNGPEVFYVSIEKLIPTEELGHGKDHDCPGEECDAAIDNKVAKIMSGKFDPIVVCHQKPLNVARLQDKEEHTQPPKNPAAEPFYYVLDGHHRLEAAHRIGMRKVPVVRKET